MIKYNICSVCGKYNCFNNICTRCKEKQKIIELRKIKIWIYCKYCGKEVETNKSKEKQHKNKGGIICEECRKEHARNGLKKYLNSLSPKERSEKSKKARSKVKNSSEAVKKQWETIRNDTKKWEKMREQRSKQGKISWDNQTEEQKKKRLQKWLSSRSRSKVSENLKNELVKNDLYDDFVSEEIFHGFVPDEINHKLKIIIEMYGDLYHCNPRKYKNPDLYLKTIGRTVGEQWKRDQIRLACFYKHDYTVIIVWEKDWYNNPNKQIERIKNEIDKKRSIKRTI